MVSVLPLTTRVVTGGGLGEAICCVTDVAGPLPPVTVTLPAWLITTTVLTGDEIWYTVVNLCVPGIDRLGLTVAAAACAAGAGLAAVVAWHPASASPRSPSRPASNKLRIRSIRT